MAFCHFNSIQGLSMQGGRRRPRSSPQQGQARLLDRGLCGGWAQLSMEAILVAQDTSPGGCSLTYPGIHEPRGQGGHLSVTK